MLNLSNDHKDFFGLLNNRGVHYLVVGGYAMQVHGLKRETGDVDIVVAIPDIQSASTLTTAIRDFGFGSALVDPALFLSKKLIVQLDLEPKRIDVMNYIDGIKAEDAWPRRIQVLVDTISVSVMGLEDLIINKKSSLRDKDLVDLGLLQAIARDVQS